MKKDLKNVLVTGGAGYVGAVLVSKLIREGYKVKVIDLYIYGEDVLKDVKSENLIEVKGDIRDKNLIDKELKGIDAVIHLACISNDPSYELNPSLGKSINYDAFIELVELAKKHSIKRFIYASSSSVYGIKKEKNVTEDLPLEPLTDYSKYKAECEKYLLENVKDEFVYTIVRPATVCGYSPRQRLDLTVNILTNHAVNKGEMIVYGGEQLRPNIHIEDMTDLYVKLLEYPEEKIHGEIFNAGYENYRIIKLAEMVKNVVGRSIPIKILPTNDMRSYHISSEKIRKKIGFIPVHTVEESILDLKYAFTNGKILSPLKDTKYYNLMRMREVKLK